MREVRARSEPRAAAPRTLSLSSMLSSRHPASAAKKTSSSHTTTWESWNSLRDTSPEDLIVLATHGRTGLKRLFLGSTAERVARQRAMRRCQNETQAPNV